MRKPFLALTLMTGIFMATAQTKEETINWLKEKLKGSGQSY